MLELRTLTDDDLAALRRVDELAFGHTATEDRWKVASGALERERQIGAFFDGTMVGHTAAFTFEMTLPGGALVPTAGVTWVAVSPEHRRRGVLKALMRQQIDEFRGDGEPVAALWAAEPAIYGRFGYGLASRRFWASVPRGVGLRGPKATDLRVRILEIPESLDLCDRVFEQVRRRVPGMVTRTREAALESSFDEPQERGGTSALHCAVAVTSSGDPVGYAWFSTKPNWESAMPEGTVDVREMVATSPAADRALLDVLLDLDLMSECKFWNLATDHPLVHLTAHSQRVRLVLLDQLWVQLVRLDEALAARTYATPVDVVLDVEDPFCRWNAGRWRLAADPGGATVERTTAPVDVSLDVRDLAAGYLGEDMIGPAHRAGLIVEHTTGAATALARAMRGDQAPWCAYMF